MWGRRKFIWGIVGGEGECRVYEEGKEGVYVNRKSEKGMCN